MTEQRPHPAKRLWRATLYSLAGLRSVFIHERAFREEVYVLVVVAPLGWYLGQTGVERTLLIGSWLAVIVVELLNSAIEAVVDRTGREHHDLAGRAKDYGSAAVFCAIALSVLTWILVLTDRTG